MKFDRCMAVFMLVSAAVCIGICIYLENTKVCLVNTKPVSEYKETTTEPTSETIQANTTDEEQLVEVKYAFIDDFGLPRVIIKNNTDQLYGYSLHIKYYDADKTLITEESKDLDAVVPAGFTDGTDRFLPFCPDAKYISAAVTQISLLNEVFDITPVYTNDFCTLSDIACKGSADECPFISFGEPAVITQEGSALKDLRFDIKNTLQRKIKNIEFLIAEYDNSGKAVSTRPNGFIRENIRKLSWDDAELGPSEQKTLAASMVLDKNCTKVIMTINHVEFEDGGVWTAPDILDWIISR